MPEEINIARQWVVKAKSDLLNADNNLQATDIPFDTVCFHCQQAAEKLLKAYLAGKREMPPATHDLLMLLEKVIRTNPQAGTLRDDLALLTPYAVEIRYPDDFIMPSQKDATEAREAAGRVLSWIGTAFPEILHSGPDSDS